MRRHLAVAARASVCRAAGMKIATWNVNGIKARLDTVMRWLKHAQPDVACLQEIKSIDEAFPVSIFEDAGYHVATHGQKGFNGVALISKPPLADVRRSLPGDDKDRQSRYIEALVMGQGAPFRIASIYLPNGNPVNTEKFSYKLAWMERLERYAEHLLQAEEQTILAGDFNVIPEPVDCYAPQAWSDDALFRPESRVAFRRLKYLGFTDALRACNPNNQVYTFWDYQAGAWQKNNGIRIDHLMLSPQASDRLKHAGVDKHMRGQEQPSDHVPVYAEFDVS